MNMDENGTKDLSGRPRRRNVSRIALSERSGNQVALRPVDPDGEDTKFRFTSMLKPMTILSRKARAIKAAGSYDGPLQLRVQLLEARNLLARNQLTGTGDPVALVFCGSESHKSAPVTGTCNPRWAETISFTESEENKLSGVKVLYVQIKDASAKRESSANLGAITIPLKKVRAQEKHRMRPRWFKLQMTEGMTKVSGEVRIGLRFLGVRDDAPPQKTPPPYPLPTL